VKHDMKNRQDFAGLRRMAELAHPECDHSWLWSLSQHKGPTLNVEQYVDAVRGRLGIAGPSEPLPCELCGNDLLDSAGAHALCCARGESTRGHNGVARRLFETVASCDPGAELEAPSLIPGTSLRPADVLTSILGAGLTALDVGIASPDAQNAGDDCVDAMYRRKMETYAEHADALDRQNIVYQPLVISCYGRPHPRTTAILRTLAKRVARRRGCSAVEWRYKRLQAALTVEIWRRAALMVRACWSGKHCSEEQLVTAEMSTPQAAASATQRPLTKWCCL